MLIIKFITDKALLAELYAALKIEGGVSGANFVMFNAAKDKEEPVGLMQTVFRGEILCINQIKYLPNADDDDKEFFLRAMLFKFKEGAPIVLRIECVSQKFAAFGFIEADEGMEVLSTEIDLHSRCESKK